MYTKVQKTSLSLFMLIALLMIDISGASEAKVKTVTGQLRLVATLGGKPAFRSVIWKLTQKSPNSRSSGKVLYRHRHTVTLDLEPGKYQISVSLGNTTRTRQITIKESTKQSLIIDLG